MTDEELVYVMKMKDEATRVLSKFQKELKNTGGVSKTMADEMKRTNAALKDADQLMDHVSGSTKEVSSAMKGLAGQLGQMVTGAAVLYSLQRSVASTMKSFMLMQDGMSEVRKTSGLAGADLEAVKESIDAIGRAVPTPMQNLYEFAAVAGRAGISGKEALAEFTKTAAQMSVALDNIDPEVLLRALGNTKEALDENGGVAGNVKMFAATLNLLDDTSKTSASKILELATDVAAAGAQFDLSYKDVLAWSTVLAESGVDAGIASTTILKLGREIQLAAQLGGENLQTLAMTAGMTGDKFKALAERDVAAAINTIIEGLSRMDVASQQSVLKQFELDAVMSSKAISVLTGKVDILRERIAQVNNEPLALSKFEAENTAQLEKFSSQLQLLKTNLQQLKAAIGADFADAFEPIVRSLADMVIALTDWYSSLDEGTQKFIAFGGAITVGGAGVLLTLGQMGLALQAFSTLAGMAGVSGAAAGTGIAGMLAAAGPAVAVVGALAAIVYIMADAFEVGSGNIMNVAGASAEGAAKLAEYKVQAEQAASAQDVVSSAADTMAQRLEYARTHVWNLDQALKNLGITAQWSAFQMATARLQENKMELAKVRRNRVIYGSMPIVGGAAKALADKQESALVAEQQELYVGMAYAAGDAFNTGMEKARGGPVIQQPPSGVKPTVAIGGGSVGNGNKAKGGTKSAAESQADKDLKARAEALRTVQLETREAEDMYLSLLAGYGDGFTKIEEEKALIKARWDLRKREGNDNLDLTAEEIKALKERVSVTEKTNNLIDQRMREAQARLDIQADAADYQGRMAIGFGDTAENAANLSVLEERVRLMREEKTLSMDEEMAIRQRAEAQWALNDAQREYNDLKQRDFATFDLFSNALGDMLTFSKGLKGTFRDLVTGLRDLAVQFLVLIPLKRAFETSYNAGGGFFSSLGAAFGGLFANGGAFNNGVQFFAQGGVVDRPMAFGLRGGIGVMGEDGAEAIMPLARGRNGKLGVQMSGDGGGGGLTIGTLQVNVNAPDNETDPAMFGRIISEAIESKLAQFTRRESRPGGMLWGR